MNETPVSPPDAPRRTPFPTRRPRPTPHSFGQAIVATLGQGIVVTQEPPSPPHVDEGPDGGVREWSILFPTDSIERPPSDVHCLPMQRREPEYPESARRRRIEGEVVVEVAIDRTGSVSGAQVLRAQPAGVFEDAVLRAVRRWRYKVSADSGEASCARAQVRLRFELPR